MSSCFFVPARILNFVIVITFVVVFVVVVVVVVVVGEGSFSKGGLLPISDNVILVLRSLSNFEIK